MFYTIEESEELMTVTVKQIEDIMFHAATNLDVSKVESVTIILNPELEDEGVAGRIDELDIGEFELEIDPSLSYEDMVRTIFHEMVHVSQIARGDLVLGWPSSWKGKEYSGDYMELPWEVEAYSRESDLARPFL